MISNLTSDLGSASVPASTTECAAIVTPDHAALPVSIFAGAALLVPHDGQSGTLQPVADVCTYLAHRAPVPRWEMEPRLFSRVPLDLRSQVKRLQSAVLFVRSLSASRTGHHALKVQPACVRALAIYPDLRPLNTFRNKYDVWLARQDWLVLLNRAKAGAVWQTTNRGLSDIFLDHVAAVMGDFKRNDAGRQAIDSVRRHWITGRNHRGESFPIPGYAENWESRNVHIEPAGWHPTNIRRQLQKRAKFSKAVKALRHEGIAAARAFVPHVHSTRKDLRFMELIQFDDVRCDFRVMDTESGQVNDLWLLIARDVATTMLLGFGMRPARARDDGSQEHLKLQDMKQLTGWLLETYGLPPYQMTWKIERGTATLAQGTADALTEMLGTDPRSGMDRINVSWSSMINGKSPAGYGEKAVGNSKAKAMLESLNRLQHMLTSHFPGQIGLNYSKRPTELLARETEAIEIWTEARPADRAELRYPFYTIPQAREGLFEIFGIENRRTEHNCEGFREIAEWFDGRQASGGQWQPAHTAPADMTDIKVRRRMESPIERAGWLLRDCAPFTKVSPEIITAFYEHTQRRRPVENNGEIQLMHEGKTLRFAPPSQEFTLSPGTKVLCYFNPDDPRFLTLTDGRGCVLGTWLRTGLVRHGDHDALAAAIRHSTTALNTAKTRAVELAAGERAELQAMRDHNRQVAGSHDSDFVEVYESPRNNQTEVRSPVAGRLRAVAGEKQVAKKQQRDRAEDERIAREALEL